MSRFAVITGSSAGIGRATAARFVDDGWIVHNLSRSPSGLKGVEDHAVDLSDLDALEAAADGLAAALPDDATVCLVHNAAIVPQGPIGQIDRAAFEHTLRLNVTAPALLTARLLPTMGRGSSVLYVGSTLSEQGVAGMAAYVTSKHALLGLMRATCQDLFGTGIHTALICPGFTDAGGTGPAHASSAEFRAFVADKVAFGRLVTPDEVAEVIRRTAEMPVLNGNVLHAHLGHRTT